MMTNEQDEPSSRGPLTLKFFGVDDDETSSSGDEEEEEEQKQQEGNINQTYTSDLVVNTCNGNSHSLTVNNCYGKRIFLLLFEVRFDGFRSTFRE